MIAGAFAPVTGHGRGVPSGPGPIHSHNPFVGNRTGRHARIPLAHRVVGRRHRRPHQDFLCSAERPGGPPGPVRLRRSPVGPATGDRTGAVPSLAVGPRRTGSRPANRIAAGVVGPWRWHRQRPTPAKAHRQRHHIVLFGSTVRRVDGRWPCCPEVVMTRVPGARRGRRPSGPWPRTARSRPPRPRLEPFVELFAADGAAFVTAIGLFDVVLIGHPLGGAAALAAVRPARGWLSAPAPKKPMMLWPGLPPVALPTRPADRASTGTVSFRDGRRGR